MGLLPVVLVVLVAVADTRWAVTVATLTDHHWQPVDSGTGAEEAVAHRIRPVQMARMDSLK